MVVAIQVSTSTPLVDEVINIVVTGLFPDQRITVVAHIVEDKRGWASYGHFQATNEGMVNLAEHHSLGGSYKGKMPMGLFWSLKVLPGEREGIRLLKKDTSEPLRYKLLVYDGFVEAAEVLQSGVTPLITKALNRWYRAKGVTVKIIRSGAVRGKLYLPPGTGPFPGIIDMYGSTGGIFECRSALLASRGFATLCLPFINYEDIPDVVQVDLEYFEEAIEVLCNHPKVMSHGIGVIGTSMGAEIGLQMASYLPNKDKVRAVVAVGACVAHAPHILHKGKEFSFGYTVDFFEYDEGVSFQGPNTVIPPEGVIQFENATAKLLFLYGEDDKSVNTGKNCAALTDYMEKHSLANCEILVYPGAGHMIEPPYTPHIKNSWHHLFGLSAFGGNVVDHSFAQEDSWKKVLSFFREHVCNTQAFPVYSKL